jgi:CheY-like chemotaxis protein
MHPKLSVALVDSDAIHAAALANRLRARQLNLTAHRSPEDALQALRRDFAKPDIMIVNVSDISQPWLAILRRLQEACSGHSSPQTPLFLCTTRIKRHPEFQLSLERIGVRFVCER